MIDARTSVMKVVFTTVSGKIPWPLCPFLAYL